jgi:hypothetical protein
MSLIALRVYTGVGVVCLWFAMWAYWAGFQKSQRVGWFLVLLLGMHYGAMLYALYVWKKRQIKRIPSDAGL